MDCYSYDLQRDPATNLFWIVCEAQTGYEYDTNAAEHEIISVRGPISEQTVREWQESADHWPWELYEPQEDDAILNWACTTDLQQVAHLADDPIEGDEP